jgi:hypothetical protein
MKNPLRKRTLGLLSIALLLIAGCSELPTAPEVNVPGHSAAGSMSLTSDPGGDSGSGGSSHPTAVIQSITDSEPISGITGGTVSAGAFKVIIPPGAIVGSAVVTVTQPDLSKLQCDLSISPPTENHFLIPVTLIANASSLSPTELSGSTIQWYNPTTQAWQNMPGVSLNLLTCNLSVALWHFSQYRVEGRAGW